MSILAVAPAVCYNWSRARKPKPAKNPGKNGLSNFRH
jgi:hypothetical protein